MKQAGETNAVITKIASLLAITTGCVVVAGYLLNISSFKSWFNGFGEMKFSTAASFLLSGITLFIINGPQRLGKTQRIAASACSWLVLVIGSFSLLQYFFPWNSGIAALLSKGEPGSFGRTISSQMSLIVSFNFTMLGFIFLALTERKNSWTIQALLIAIIPGSLLILLNHLFGVTFLKSISFSAPTALHTALLFIILAIGIFFSPVIGFLRFSFVKKMAAFFVLIFLFRSLVFFAMNKNNEQGKEIDKKVEHTNMVLSVAEKLNWETSKIESDVRGYMLTGDVSYCSFFLQAQKNISNSINFLRQLTLGNNDQQVRIDSLSNSVNVFLTVQRDLVNADVSDKAHRTQILRAAGITDALLKTAGHSITAIEFSETQSLAKLKADHLKSIENTSRLFTFFQFIVILMFVVALKMIYSNSVYRNKVEGELTKSLKDVSDYKFAIDESSILVITDHDGIIRQVNDNFCHVTKYSREDLLGQDHRIINSGYHDTGFMRNLWTTINNGEIWQGEIKNKAKDGSYFWLDTTIVPFMNEHGKPYQYVAIRSDISQRKKLEEEIHKFNEELQQRVVEKTEEALEKDQQYRFLLQNMTEGIQIIDFDWKYVFVNDSALQQSRYSIDELLGYTLMEKYPGVEKTEFFKVLQKCMQDRESRVLENEFTFPDGRKSYFQLSIQPVAEGLFVLSTDIQDRKKAEEKLRESLGRYELVNKATRDTIWEWDLKSNSLRWNDMFTTSFGYARDNNGKNNELEFEYIHPADRERVRSNIRDCINNKLDYWHDEYRFRAADGKYRNIYGRGFVQYDEKQIPIRMVGAMTDLTEKKDLEKALSEQRMKQQKLLTEVAIQTQEKEKNALGKELHDNVNQILSTVKIYLGMIKEGHGDPSDNLAGKSYEYISTAIDDLRKLSHSLVAPSLGEVGLQDALLSLVDDTKVINKLKVRLTIDDRYKSSEIDKNVELMLYRIAQEQLNNIIKYSQASEVAMKIGICSSNLYLSVADNGIGFDTTKKARGIGLKNISNRVAFYCGEMDIASEPGKGCTLHVSIPFESAISEGSTLQSNSALPSAGRVSSALM